jgi:ectoine hydroxylase-related dioxygenase (phytanoyl-CoA dioxygenase family)
VSEQGRLVVTLDSKKEQDWLELTLESVSQDGIASVTNVLDSSFIEKTRAAMYRVQEELVKDVGEDRLTRAGELGVLRLMPKYDLFFLSFLEIPEVLSVIDRTVSNTAILHTQNGFILPSFSQGEAPLTFQNSFHQDFPRFFNGYLASINIMFAVDEFSAENGATRFVPRSHQTAAVRSQEYLNEFSIVGECPAGSMLVFDSTLWHRAGSNISGKDRLAINHQFTRSFIKQQIDYVRALGDAAVLAQKCRTQQLLGWYTRVVTSLDEYYRPEDERLYRRAQG